MERILIQARVSLIVSLTALGEQISMGDNLNNYPPSLAQI